MTAALAVGDEAWALTQSAPTPSGRRTVEGAALVRIESVSGDDYIVSVVRGSGVPSGHLTRRRLARGELYARRDRAEHAAFADAVRRVWAVNPGCVAPQPGAILSEREKGFEPSTSTLAKGRIDLAAPSDVGEEPDPPLIACSPPGEDKPPEGPESGPGAVLVGCAKGGAR